MQVPQGSVKNARPNPEAKVLYDRLKLDALRLELFAGGLEVLDLKADAIEHAAARRRLH
jgi:hypothetical protein